MSGLGLDFSVVPPKDDVEPRPDSGESPEKFALRSAQAKAKSFFLEDYIDLLDYENKKEETTVRVYPDECIIISADTVVVQGKNIFGKPRSPEEALEFLKKLSKDDHEVISACVVLYQAEEIIFSEKTRVRFWDCPEPLLKAYADTGEGLDKAGAYAIQGKGAFLVKEIRGSWSNVVGLPIAQLVDEMYQKGWVEIK